MLASTALGVVQSADRLVLSSAASIYDFAQYSLASSTMMVPVTLIAGMARVFLPHFAVTEKERHPERYRMVSRLILLAWTALLPYYFFVDFVVRHFLPRYLPTLSLARVLILGVLFWAGIQILHGNVFNLYGKQKSFLLYSVVAVGVSLGLAATAILIFHSIWLVAAMQVGTLGVWWLFNSYMLRSLSGESWADLLQVVFVFAWSAISLWLSIRWSSNYAARTLCYWALATGPVGFLCRREIVLIADLFKNFRNFLPSSALASGISAGD